MVVLDAPEKLKTIHHTSTLEDVFVTLTGHNFERD
jgi:hypothetical protein